MKVRAVLLWAGVACAVAGCASSYSYLVSNDDCRCDRFMTSDPNAAIQYVFQAEYRVDDGIRTRIEIEIWNRTSDTVDLSLAHVKVNSRNVPYRYNDRFLPIDLRGVLPGRRETLMLVGESGPIEHDAWLLIAGEELVVTLKGMRLSMRELQPQIIHFVPYNPKLGA